MIGETVESRPGSPVGAALLLAAAVGLGAAAVVLHSLHWALLAALPLTLAAALFLTRPRPFRVELTADALTVPAHSLSVPYDVIEGLITHGRPDRARFPIQVVHPNGVLFVPDRLTVPSRDLFTFLASRLAPSGSRRVPDLLLDYLRRQEEAFGPERVFSYRARREWGGLPRGRAVAVLLAVGVTGLAWLASGAAGPDYLPWAVIGGVLAFCGLAFAGIYAVAPQQSRIRNWRAAGLVISPVGLALVQGDLRGELRWDELRAINYPSKPRSFALSSHQQVPVGGIELVVEGASIVIVDLYDRPLPLIYERLRAYLAPANDGG
jgi:hypothetical protein